MKKLIVIAITALALSGCVPADRVADNAPVEPWVANAELFGTSVELERGLWLCDQQYRVPADHTPDHPESIALAECVKSAYAQ